MIGIARSISAHSCMLISDMARNTPSAMSEIRPSEGSARTRGLLEDVRDRVGHHDAHEQAGQKVRQVDAESPAFRSATAPRPIAMFRISQV